MEVTPKTFRDVQFREKRGGYHPEDVDQFLEEAAAGVEVLQERLRQALDRAQRAEAAAADAGSSDETLKRTLVLAQRTADMAVQESREQASRVLSSAEHQAQALVAEAEDRARRLHGEALADVHAELAKLEAIRAQAQQEVDALTRWTGEHRTHLTTTLQDAMAMVERAGVLTPPPTSSPIDVPFAARRAGTPNGTPNGTPGNPGPPSTSGNPVALPPAPAAEPADPRSAQGRPVDEDTRAVPMDLDLTDGRRPDAGRPDAGRPDAPRVDAPRADTPGELRTGEQRAVTSVDAPARDPLAQPDDEALDSFFDDNDFGDDRRFGGRLRRRR